MDYEQKQREAFYLTKKYSSYAWCAEIYRLWKAFCDGYERDFYKFPIREPLDSGTAYAGKLYEPSEWDEQNLKMFWGYAAAMDEGLQFMRQGNRVLGCTRFREGGMLHQWLFSRRFEEIDLSVFGYQRNMLHAAENTFLFAQKAYAMSVQGAIFPHTDELRKDYSHLENDIDILHYATARKIKIPFGVPPGALPPVPVLDPNAISIMSGDEVPVVGIWVVEPDEEHRGQTYCMAYLRPAFPALMRVSEQEYDSNTRYIRTRNEIDRADCDKIPDYPVRWRLLWADDRNYTHGNTPIEEADYLTYYPPVKTNSNAQRLRCEAGQDCPKTGFWTTPAKQNSRTLFSQGDPMPSVGGDYGLTIWELEVME